MPNAHRTQEGEEGAPEESFEQGSFEQGAPSFRVYTAAELANRPLRSGRPPAQPTSVIDEIYDGLVRVKHVGFRGVIKWLAIGIAVGAALLALLVIVGNLTDDTRLPPEKRVPYASISPTTKLIPPVAPAAPAPQPATANATDDSDTAFELPDDSAPPPSGATPRTHQRGARPAAAKKKPAEVRIMRNAPF